MRGARSWQTHSESGDTAFSARVVGVVDELLGEVDRRCLELFLLLPSDQLMFDKDPARVRTQSLSFFTSVICDL